ncbi:MAG: endonuclease/exonuclease/phosphatase family protein [Asticcacaulis sp.]|uniref:endonuclease/exonuclease/phosphatase family protein n=1 Tax=Asticcacaulis sp. TaxID=1872648 RepID=UPI0039E38044
MRLFSLVAALCVAAFPVGAETLRVMSYNIRVDVEGDNPRWAERRDPMAKQIAFTAPDIFGVQEAKQTAVADLSDRLPTYDHYGIGRDDGVNGETTTLFYDRTRFFRVAASTQWCSKTPDVPGKDADAALPRTFTRLILRDRRSGRLFDVRNAHFDHIGVVARENCARQIENLAPYQDAIVLVMGDFNSGTDSAPYRILTGESGLNLKDARTGAVIDFGPQGTFNDFDIRQTNGEAIDHIFVGRTLTVSRFGVLTDSFGGRVISDHFPIVADVVLP